jgi:flavin-dependent dehydrogenase
VTGATCVSAGARIDVGATVTIAADGRRSSLAFALGLARHPPSPRRWAVGAHAIDVHGLSSVGEMHIRQGHYIGVAPLPGGLANVCLVKPAGTHDASLRNPRRALLDAVAGDTMLRDRFADARLLADPLVLGPLAVDAAPGVPPRGLLLAGDAAGFVDPMTGDGLRFALRGGELAAHAALRALEHGWDDVHASLEEARRREFGPKCGSIGCCAGWSDRASAFEGRLSAAAWCRPRCGHWSATRAIADSRRPADRPCFVSSCSL